MNMCTQKSYIFPPSAPQSAQSRILIKNGQIVNDDQTLQQDIYIEDGVIKLVCILKLF